MRKALAQMEQEKAKQKQQSKVEKQQDDKTKDKSYRGKQTMDKLMRQNVQLSNIEITDGNIKSFERVAKKYSIDFSLKKIRQQSRRDILFSSKQGMQMS